MKPPSFATVLFDGSGLGGWVGRDGAPARWRVDGEALEVVAGTGDVLTGPTRRALDEAEGEPGPLLLQDHGDAVRFRNVWLVRLDGAP